MGMTKGDKPQFSDRMLRAVYRERMRVPENGGSLLERNAMFCEVGACFVGIPFEPKQV